MRQVRTFWNRFAGFPDSIRNTGRMKHQRQIPLTIGAEQTTVVVTDIPAFSSAYPSIAALLDSVGLTAEQAMAYRMAIVRSGIARLTGMTAGSVSKDSTATKRRFAPISPTSALGKNLEFWNARDALFGDIGRAGVLTMQ